MPTKLKGDCTLLDIWVTRLGLDHIPGPLWYVDATIRSIIRIETRGIGWALCMSGMHAFAAFAPFGSDVRSSGFDISDVSCFNVNCTT